MPGRAAPAPRVLTRRITGYSLVRIESGLHSPIHPLAHPLSNVHAEVGSFTTVSKIAVTLRPVVFDDCVQFAALLLVSSSNVIFMKLYDITMM